MPFNFLNQGQTDDTATRFQPIDTFIDPVSKIRVSNPANLIDTDFEYGLQPTKWETVEIINNTPAFFSKSGDTTISDITGITTNGGTREITVTTAFPHLLDVGIPIRVSGTKSVTADGSYIINATPTATTFTYLARANQPETISIFDLYSSIITGEFFQGSQISISDAEGMTTDGAGPNSTITIKTENKHGFGPKTPFYFLNLNSTVSQEFESQNSTSLSFDPTNSATAQSFDGSNTLIQTPVDLSNSASTSQYENTISSTNPTNATITISIAAEDTANWGELVAGSPLYYDVNVGSGYFQANPKGVVFIKSVDLIDTNNNTATFQVSQLPDGNAIPILANMTGYFKIADQAVTFAGNNVDPDTQINVEIIKDEAIIFDGGNQGFVGDPAETQDPSNSTCTVVGFTGDTISVFTAEGELNYYVGSMILYTTDDTAATNLSNNTTYFVNSIADGPSSGLYNITIAEYPGQSNITPSGGSGSQQFAAIGISVDKDIVHIKDAAFEEGDLLEYTSPDNGAFGASAVKNFYFVATAYDTHNYQLNEEAYSPVQASGGTILPDLEVDGRTYKVHQFTTTGTDTFSVTSSGTEPEIEYLIVAGGGGGGASQTVTTSNHWTGGGGGAGGVLMGKFNAEDSTSYTITVGDGGAGAVNNIDFFGQKGSNSSIVGGSTSLVATGGGGGETRRAVEFGQSPEGMDGGSGGGGSDRILNASGSNARAGNGIAGQGNSGGVGFDAYTAGGGGGAGGPGLNGQRRWAGDGGPGVVSYIRGSAEWFGGGGGGGARPTQNLTRSLGGIGGGGNGNITHSGDYRYGGDGAPNTGGGGGGNGDDRSNDGERGQAGNGGSGIVIVRYPITAPTVTPSIGASGGDYTDIVTINSQPYRIHQFSNLSTSIADKEFVVFDAPSGSTVDILLVAGGGAGGFGYGDQDTGKGGGGAGGVILRESVAVSNRSYFVSVGRGGRKRHHGANYTPQPPINGENTEAFGLTAIGGGGGGQSDNYNNGPRSGGSGGGGGARNGTSSYLQGDPGLQPTSTDGGFGNSGGNAGGNGNRGGGGGGGAGAAGSNGENNQNNSRGGVGGIGVDMSQYFGTGVGENGYFGGGGGGGSYRHSSPPFDQSAGGLGGGGDGISARESRFGAQWLTENVDGQPTTGGGGGGASEDANNAGRPNQGSSSGGGGSGTVIIRYPVTIQGVS